MYGMAKKARESLRNKAKKMASGADNKVDSSDWTPAEPLNADVKTGMRPISRRAFKSGGKVDGSCGPMRADRKPRKSGGKADDKAEAKQIAVAKMNRNLKEANEEREGIKHVGGFKKGGRTGKETGGGLFMNGRRIPSSTTPKPIVDKTEQRASTPAEIKRAEAHMSQMGKSVSTDKGMTADEARRFLEGRKAGGRTKKKDGGLVEQVMDRKKPGYDIGYELRVKRAQMEQDDPSYNKGQGPTKQNAANLEYSKELDRRRSGRKEGGRTKKMMGGPMMGGMDPRMGMVKDRALDFGGQGITPGVSAMKKGGKVHTDEAMDKALIKKMVKPEARKGKAIGGILTKSGVGGLIPMAMDAMRGDDDKKEKAHGGRTARKDGGRAKGKTDINIIISAGGKPAPQDGMMPPPGMDMGMPPGLPPGLPVPVSAPPPGQAASPPMPMPIPMPMPMPASAPGRPEMPLARKSGGRITKVASSYKDMEAGAGSGEGRLQKTDIAAKLPKPGLKRGVIVDDNKGYPNKVNGATGGRTARATGGKTYRSYKDMDAGAGSGKGRLEKTEIQKRQEIR